MPPEAIVGIIGVETIYGRFMGNFRALDALTTLTFDYPTRRTAPIARRRSARISKTYWSGRTTANRSDHRARLVHGRDRHSAIPAEQHRAIRGDFDGNEHIDLRTSQPMRSAVSRTICAERLGKRAGRWSGRLAATPAARALRKPQPTVSPSRIGRWTSLREPDADERAGRQYRSGSGHAGDGRRLCRRRAAVPSTRWA